METLRGAKKEKVEVRGHTITQMFIMCHTARVGCFRFVLLKVIVNGHVGIVATNFLGLQTDIEMNDTQSPAIQHRPSKHAGLVVHYHFSWTEANTQERSNITLFLGRLRPLSS